MPWWHVRKDLVENVVNGRARTGLEENYISASKKTEETLLLDNSGEAVGEAFVLVICAGGHHEPASDRIGGVGQECCGDIWKVAQKPLFYLMILTPLITIVYPEIGPSEYWYPVKWYQRSSVYSKETFCLEGFEQIAEDSAFLSVYVIGHLGPGVIEGVKQDPGRYSSEGSAYRVDYHFMLFVSSFQKGF